MDEWFHPSQDAGKRPLVLNGDCQFSLKNIRQSLKSFQARHATETNRTTGETEGARFRVTATLGPFIHVEMPLSHHGEQLSSTLNDLRKNHPLSGHQGFQKLLCC